MTTTDPQSAVDEFNSANHVGTLVRYWRGVHEGAPSGVGRTRTLAEVLSGHTAVVWISGTSGCIALTHVEPVPDQPDGIEEDSRDMPDPRRAAERVVEYIAASGDGLYDVQGNAPLYGRDLESICRSVLAEGATR